MIEAHFLISGLIQALLRLMLISTLFMSKSNQEALFMKLISCISWCHIYNCCIISNERCRNHVGRNFLYLTTIDTFSVISDIIFNS
ncbi:unnamed protein product [Moneuplotes crassus]|uniref:Uncharacterized protein n=1 Tax=Euplotes crassus TaxID=5936 RepID=A0AAD2D3N0_EUPCR|nr:unnamed protein product [Moneuplotes crassus]